MNTKNVSDLRAHLTQAGLITPASALVAKPAKVRLEQLVPGEWHNISGVRCFRSEQSFPLTHEHGSRRLNELLEIPAAVWSPFLVKGETLPLDIRQAVFLDTETTGLGQNPSTFAFMVGIGHFEGDVFGVRQYFMPDPASEEGLLDLLEQDISGREGLVTFNGRCFDWPLIEMRYALNRRTPPLPANPHLDLLPLARRLWRRRLTSCSLSSLEANLMEIHRTAADVPGYMIPQLYREYVDFNMVEPMAGVFYHNVQDILSMVSLATTAGRTLTSLDEPARVEGTDYIALGALFTRLGRSEEALHAMRLATESCPDPAELALAYKHWSMLLKRLKQWEQAAEIWEKQLGGTDIYSYIELAKYYEHHLRDTDLAVQVVQQALTWLQDGRSSLSRMERQQYNAEFIHRLERLERRRNCTSAVNDAR
ncbi:MAG: ribonuclease H-like domain-containing protein [Chloroflexi bacterium]|nr:ribonuclease H-like domain-containing protein [Chloroflexota bacterium]